METSAGNQPRQHDVPGSLAAAGIGPPSKSRADPFGPADPVCTDLSCGGRRSLFGWSPPPEAADTHLKRWVDQLMPRTGLPALLFFAAIVAVLAFAAHLPMRGALAVDGLAALAGGGWCSLNFWRCRHAHCLVTGVGWIALSGFAFAEAGLGRLGPRDLDRGRNRPQRDGR